MADDSTVRWEIVSDADVPQVKVLAGQVRVQVWEGTSQSEAVQALRQLADELTGMGTNEWRQLVGEPKGS